VRSIVKTISVNSFVRRIIHTMANELKFNDENICKCTVKKKNVVPSVVVYVPSTTQTNLSGKEKCKMREQEKICCRCCCVAFHLVYVTSTQ
jgi:hypothetical protein